VVRNPRASRKKKRDPRADEQGLRGSKRLSFKIKTLHIGLGTLFFVPNLERTKISIPVPLGFLSLQDLRLHPLIITLDSDNK
jgi:hypothetical protein